MANLTNTTVDLASVQIGHGEYEDDQITFAGAATLLEGTILARDSVSGRLVPFVKGGSTNENGIPKAVLTYELTATGAGDLPARVSVKGTFRLQRLVIDADGDASNIDAAVKDQLRDYGLNAISVDDLSVLDNA